MISPSTSTPSPSMRASRQKPGVGRTTASTSASLSMPSEHLPSTEKVSCIYLWRILGAKIWPYRRPRPHRVVLGQPRPGLTFLAESKEAAQSEVLRIWHGRAVPAWQENAKCTRSTQNSCKMLSNPDSRFERSKNAVAAVNGPPQPGISPQSDAHASMREGPSAHEQVRDSRNFFRADTFEQAMRKAKC